MPIHQAPFTVTTRGRGPVEITHHVNEHLRQSGLETGLCHVFCCHTSASLTITENADPTVLRDLEGHLVRTIPDGDPRYAHDMEGPDDMSAHIRSVLTGTGLTVPFARGRLSLGTWQGIFLWEHRTHGHGRRVIVTCQGEAPASTSMPSESRGVEADVGELRQVLTTLTAERDQALAELHRATAALAEMQGRIQASEDTRTELQAIMARLRDIGGG